MNAPCALLIDDHAMFRAGLRQVIKVAIPDLDIFEAGSLDEAPACPSSNVTVVLLDNKLNGLSGIDGIAQIKRKWPLIETLQQVIAVDVSGDTTVVPLAQKHLTPRQSAVLGLPANALYGPCPWLILSAACALHPGRQILRPLYSGNTADKLVYAKLFESKGLRKF